MNREELRTQKIGQGWKVPPVSDWQLVSAEGLEPKKYDINNVFNPSTERYGTATVVVYNEGTAEESAVGQDEWKSRFVDDARTWLRAREGATVGSATVFAIAIERVYEDDEVIEVNAYLKDNTTTKATFVVKRRDGTFSFEKLS